MEGTTPGYRPLPILLTALAAVTVSFIPIPGLSVAAHRTLIILVVVAGLWMTEALPVPITALLIPPLGILLGVADAKRAFAGFGDPIVFLFFGTFLLTEAAAHHGLNDRLAGAVLGSRFVRASPGRLLVAVAALGCGLSAWMNNTATTAVLLPLALTAERFGVRKMLVATLLMASYAPSLGGIATPVGTAPNLIGLRLLDEYAHARPTFAQWAAVFAPLAILSTAMTAMVLGAGAPGRRAPSGSTTFELGVASRPRRPWSLAERTLIPVFVAVVLLWIAPGILAATPLRSETWVRVWQARLPEPAVPLLGALTLFVLPSARGGGPRILDVTALRRVDWGTLLLFGGGLSLGDMMFESGLARSLGEAVFGLMPTATTFGIVLASTMVAVVVSEVTSNTASASLVVPVVLALAQAAGIDPVKPALAATVGCSFGFMLPVSTPPNALVYGTGKLSVGDMVRHGVLLDVVGVLLVSAWVTVFA